MERRSESSPLLVLLVGILGLSAGKTLLTTAGPTGRPAAIPSHGEGRQDEDALPHLVGDHLAGAATALLLVGEHLGLNPEEPEILSAARKLARHAKSGATEARAGQPGGSSGRGLLLPGPAGQAELDEALDRLSTLDLEKDPNAAKARDWLLGLLVRRMSAQALLEWVRDASAARGVSVEFVIATLPDYVDSNSAWMFDASLDALQRAAGGLGYVVDRFELPDRDTTGASATSGNRRGHEKVPAAVLFRNHDDPRRLLMVLIPLETATAGIHPEAFLSAIALASAWRPDGDVRILGPSFSGSTASLRRFLQAALDQGLLGRSFPDQTLVRIISGSATSPRNKSLSGTYSGSGQRQGLRARVTFHAVVVSDDEAEVALRDFLGSIDRRWATGEKVALIVESNTAWGGALLQKSPVFPKAERLTFPLHVSRLRSMTTAPGRASPNSDTGRETLALRLDSFWPSRSAGDFPTCYFSRSRATSSI